MTVIASSVPSAKYEIEAIVSIVLAYQMYPDRLKKRLEAISEGFAEKLPSKYGWKAGQSCQNIYRNNTKTERYYININAINATSKFTIRIFE